jgi:hypothetical protein
MNHRSQVRDSYHVTEESDILWIRCIMRIYTSSCFKIDRKTRKSDYIMHIRTLEIHNDTTIYVVKYIRLSISALFQWCVVLCLSKLKDYSYLLTYLLTHGAEPFWRSRQFSSYSRISLHFMELEGSLLRSQEPFTGPYPEPDQSNP